MLPLCEILNITVNDLLTGERIAKEDYRVKADENLVDLVAQQKRDSKKKIAISAIGVFMGLFTFLFCALSASYCEGLSDLHRVLILLFGGCILLCGFVIGIVEDQSAGSYECAACKKRFVPTFHAYCFGAHTLTTRRLKCPYCGKTTFAKRRLIR